MSLDYLPIIRFSQRFTYIKNIEKGNNTLIVLVEENKNNKTYCLKWFTQKPKESYPKILHEYMIRNRILEINMIKTNEMFILCYNNQYRLALLCDWYPGKSLWDCNDGRKLAPFEIFHIGLSLAKDLNLLNDVNIVHRDVKEENIIITAEGPVLIDFGLSTIFFTDRMEKPGHGTRLFLPPEFYSEAQILSSDLRKGDVWALGLVMLSLLLKEEPRYYGELVYHMKEYPDFQCNDHRLKSIIKTCLSIDIHKRPIPLELILIMEKEITKYPVPNYNLIM